MKKISLLLAVIGAILFAKAIPLQAISSPTPGIDLIPVIIGFKLTPGPVEEKLVKAVGGRIKYSYELIPAIAARVPSAAIPGLQRHPLVTIIELDGVITATSYDVELDNTWGVKHIQAGTVHQTGNLGEGVKVAVIDSGIDYTHPEFSGVYAGGYNYVNNDDDPLDDNGHGTHVAGTIAAARDQRGVVGTSPSVNLYALKVLNANGSGNWSNVIAALDWALTQGIQITNNSYGSSTNPGTQVLQAFNNSAQAGMLHIASAGNEGNPSGKGDNVGYPGKWDSVVAVAAIDQSNKRARWSSTGPSVELSAPGVSINSTWLNSTYRLASGTSMASPHVAGTAALIMAGGVLDAHQVRAILGNTAQNLGDPLHYGFGLINAADAVGAPTPPDNEPPADEPPPDDEDKCPPGWQRQGRC